MAKEDKGNRLGDRTASARDVAKADAKKKRGARPPRQPGRFKEYFKGVKLETKKVVWPTKKELFSYTVIVIFACAFFGLLIWGVDSAFLAGLRKLLGIEI